MNAPMNDSHLDPPDYPEPPEWYLAIEDAALDQEVPQDLGTAILKLLEDWYDSQISLPPMGGVLKANAC